MRFANLTIGLSVVTLFSMAGCELIATVDRTMIPNATGGSNAGGAGGTSTSSSSSGGGAASSSSTSSSGTGGASSSSSTTSSSSSGTGGASSSSSSSGTGGASSSSSSSGTGGASSSSSSSGTGGAASSSSTTSSSSSTTSSSSTSSSSSTAASSSSGGPTCSQPSDCPPTGNECITATCVAGACGTSFVASGTPTSSQTPGDCHTNQCDGAGNIVNAEDDSDLPDDQNPCTNDLCTAGVPSHTSVGSGGTCGTGMFCDGNGHCVGCNQPTDCAGQDTDCKKRTCTANVCGFSFTTAGTPTSSQTPGDCHQNQCDGSGNSVPVIDNTDVPADDGNACTSETCNAGTPQHPPVGAGATCSQNGGIKCDGNGNCVQCLAQADCGASTACQTHACVAGTCGTMNTATGTVVANPLPGDCRSDQCDGMGGVTSNAADNTDIPADDGNQCTGETCIAGTPQHPNAPKGTMCSQNGGTTCDGNGNCVTCTTASDCGADTACRTHTCNGGVCGEIDASAGTVVANPVSGDCRSEQCDGSGNILAGQPDNTDVPADDGNQCTSESCSAGTPQHPPVPSGTMCSQNGGTECDGNGKCVQCLTASDCGADTVCQKRTCVAGACGVNNVAAGTIVSDPTPGDCHANECDGMGGIMSGVDNADLPNDNNPCTSDTCVAGVPTFTPTAPGSACGTMGGTECDGMGDCVQCVMASECPPTGNQCTAPACNAGLCGASNVASGTPTATQTPGDCQKTECDGNGGTMSVADNTDVPADDGNSCTSESCNAGVPAHPAVPALTACSQNGGIVCDDAGVCTNTVHVVRMGDGSAALSNAATAVFVEQRFVSDGALAPTGHNPLAMPTTASGNNARLTNAGNASAEGALALSVDGHYVTLAGYDAATGTASIATSTSATVNRIAGRIDASGNIDTSTKINALISGGSARSAVTDDGTHFWVGGSVSGIVYIPLGTTGGTSILSSPSNVRVADIFGGQLYGSAGSGTFTNVFTVGTGLPTMAGATATSLSGMPTSTASPYGFAFVGTSVLYVADDRAIASGGGVQKWTLSGSTWSLVTTFKTGLSAGTRGVAVFVTGSTTTIVATSATASANTLVSFIDDGTNLNPTATVLATAATNTVFRGVAPSPK